MPVKFKGASEYTDNYPAFQSHKSATFHPSPEQAARCAGLETTKSALVFEPSLQRKKRLDGPTVSLSADYYNGDMNGSEYALLGQQDKFATNIKYRPKSGNVGGMRAAPPLKQTKFDPRQEDVKPEPVKPAPVVDTQKFTEPPTPPTPLAPRKSNDGPRKTKIIQTQPKDVSRQSEKVRKSEPSGEKMQQESEPPVKQALKDKNLSDVLGEMKKKKPSMNEFAQTNMDKGVVDSAPEAPAEYAMKYKAGVAPPRASRKQSEYQREFEWKKRMASSPMLAAEQVVYNSNVGPVKASGFPKTSEYKAQFKKWRAIENEPVPAVKHAAQQRAAIKNKAMKRSKSVGAADRRAADKQMIEEEEGKADVPKPLPHHGKLRKVVTEYGANFKPPQKYSYEKGAWKGANPPHLFAQKTEAVSEKEEPALSTWYAEVMELRRKASEYKKRAQGTHFSREHLVQLLAKHAGMWDITSSRSDSSSTLSALSLEAGSKRLIQKSRKDKRGEKNLVDFDSCHATIADSEVPYYNEGEIDEEGLPQEELRPAQKKRSKNMSRKLAWLEEQQRELGEEEEVQDRLEQINMQELGDEVEQEGRLPTPLWRQSTKLKKVSRHHLDRTTPAVGGALLTSPPQPIRSKSCVSGDSEDTVEEESERKEFAKTYNLNRLLTTPTFGGPSADTHALRDDDASVDRPLRATYMYTPNEQVQELEQENLEPVSKMPVHRQSRRKEHMRPAGVPSTLYEQMGDTYNKPDLQAQPEDEDDNVSLSLSVRSIASSCSLASEVYERAKNRRDNFWGKGGIATR